jgi:tRNA pseudouridine13 synthase
VRIKVMPGDFVVEERAALRLQGAGAWTVYRVRKVGLTTLEARARLAAALGLSDGQVLFPALKDKEAVSIQFATLPAGLAERVEKEGLTAERIGYRAAPLVAGDLRGNAFTLILRDLDAAEAAHLAERLAQLARDGLPNYFHTQRFGSLTAEGEFIGLAILRRDAEVALKLYLTTPFVGDPRPVRAFKRQAATLWPDWAAMFAAAPRPSNYRSVLTYLVGHPQDYRAALNLIPQRTLSLYLAAYQSDLWNRIAGALLAQAYASAGVAHGQIAIAGRTLPVHTTLSTALRDELAAARLPLPEHHATYQAGAHAQAVERVLAEEGLVLADLKARILKKAYLTRGSRALLLVPEDVRVDAPAPDERYPGRLALRVAFALPPGSYATLVLEAASLPAQARV